MARFYLPRKTQLARALRGFGAPGVRPSGLLKLKAEYASAKQLWIANQTLSNTLGTDPKALTTVGMKRERDGVNIDGATDYIEFTGFSLRNKGTLLYCFVNLEQTNYKRPLDFGGSGELQYTNASIFNVFATGFVTGASDYNYGKLHVVALRSESTAFSAARDRYLRVGSQEFSSSAALNLSTAADIDYTIAARNEFDSQAEGIYQFLLVDSRVWSDAEIWQRLRDPWSVFESANQAPFLIGTAAAGGGPYTLTADAGSYTYTGTDATLKVGRKVSAASGTYTYTGTAATLKVGYVVPAASGAYTYTGSDATLTYTPTAATLTAEAGSYTYTGQDVTFKRGLVLSAAGGTYSYTGQDATLTYTPVGAFSLTADAGSYTYTGQTAGLGVGRKLIAGAGSYTYTGTVSGLGVGYVLTADSSTYTYTGQDSTLTKAVVLSASAGSYTYTGSAASLSLGYKIAFAAGSYTYTGTEVTFDRTYALAADAGSYVYTGQSVTLTESDPKIWTEIPSVSTTWTEI